MKINIQTLIAIITTIVTLIALHIKTFNNFFLSIVKKKFKAVPGKQSMFEFVMDIIGCVGVSLYILILGILMIRSFCNNPNNTNDNISIVKLILLIIVLIILISMGTAMVHSINRFMYLQDKFIEKMKGNNITLKNNIKLKNFIDIVIMLISFIIFGLGVLGGIYSNINIDMYEGNIILFKDSSELGVQLFAVIMEIIIGTILLIEINMKEIIKVLSNEYEYIIITKDNSYYGLYLEYTNYYLIIQNDQELYINKNEVKKLIRKCREKRIMKKSIQQNEYIKSFNKISNNKLYEQYKSVKEEILNKCKENKQYESVEYINLEIERIEENLETSKSPYLSILYAMIAAFIGMFITIVPNDWTSVLDEWLHINIKMIILLLYITVATFWCVKNIKRASIEFQTKLVYIKVLKELQKELLK